MTLQKIYNPENGQMRVAGMISGEGSTLRKIIEFERTLDVELGKSPYHVVGIFSDSSRSNALDIGKDYNLPVSVRDKCEFYLAREREIRRDLRDEYDRVAVKDLKIYDADVLAYAGYMSRATGVLVNGFMGVNSHPADLSLVEDGMRKYAGLEAVRRAMEAGEKEIRTSIHLVDEKMDHGGLLMVSQPLKIETSDNFQWGNIPEVKRIAARHQNKLKEIGDWVIFPLTLRYIAEGRYSLDEEGKLYFDEKAIPNGLRMS